MFILIPAIIIFLLLSYTYLNEVSFFTEVFIYILSILIVAITFILYRKIKQDLKLQEINALQAELLSYEKKLKQTEDKSLKIRYQKQINAIKKELDLKL